MQVRSTLVPPPKPLWGALVAQVISEIKKRFVSGLAQSELFEKDEAHDEEIPLLRKKEPMFKSGINTVKSSTFLNSTTPQQDALEDFLSDLTAYETHCIDFIISIRNNEVGRAKDFNALALSGQPAQVGRFELDFVTQQNTKGESPLFQTVFNVRVCAPQDHEEVSVHIHKKFNVIMLDESHLQLTHDTSNFVKDILWQLVKTPQCILFLCPDGAGLNGQLILMLTIVKAYTTIFASKKPNLIADEILKTLAVLRENIPCLVLTNEQCYEAVRNAEILRNYMVARRYLNPNILHVKAAQQVLPIDENYFNTQQSIRFFRRRLTVDTHALPQILQAPAPRGIKKC